MTWIYIFIAGLFEIAWAIGVKYSHGFTKFFPSVVTIMCMIASFYFLALSLKQIPIGTGYAIWTGIGVIGTAIIGLIAFHESKDPLRLFFILLIIIGVIGLRITTKQQ